MDVLTFGLILLLGLVIAHEESPDTNGPTQEIMRLQVMREGEVLDLEFTAEDDLEVRQRILGLPT